MRTIPNGSMDWIGMEDLVSILGRGRATGRQSPSSHHALHLSRRLVRRSHHKSSIHAPTGIVKFRTTQQSRRLFFGRSDGLGVQGDRSLVAGILLST